MAKRVDVRFEGSETVSKAAQKSQGAIHNLNKSVKDAQKGWRNSTLAIGAAIAAFYGLSRAVGELVEAYRVQEQAEAKLKSAILATGQSAELSAQNLIDFAGELQHVTTFGDEATISAMAMLQSLASLSEDGFKKITPLIQDFAIGMSVDLETAASLVGKTLGSTTNALSRYGVVIDMTGTKEEKLAELTTVLESKFGGMARAAADTATGSMTQLQNAMSDLKEAGGGAIAVFLQPGVKWLTRLAEEAKKSFERFTDLNELFTEGGYAEATSDIQLAQRALAQVNEQLALEKEALEKGMRLRGMTRKEAEESIVALQNKAEGLRRTIITLGKAAGDTEEKITGIKNIWTEIYGLPEYPKWLKNLYESTEQAKLDTLWAQMERAQANLAGATGEEATQLQVVIELLRGKILAMSEYIDDEQKIIDLLDEEGEKARKAAEARREIQRQFSQLMMSDFERTLAQLDEQKEAFLNAGIAQIEVEQWYIQEVEKAWEAEQQITEEKRKQREEVEKLAAIEAYREKLGAFAGAAESFAGTEVGKATVGEGLIGEAFDPLMYAIQAVAEAFMSVASLAALFDPLKTILKAMMAVLEPVLNDLLKPLVGILAILGQTLGKILIPVFKLLAPVIELVAKAFVWFYNFAIVPVGNFIIWLVVTINNFIAKLVNGIIKLINKLPFVNIKWRMAEMSYEEMKLQKISTEDLESAGEEAMAREETEGVGSTTTIQRVPDIYIYQTFQGHIIGAGGMREFGEFTAEALQEYAGIGGRIHIAEAVV
jgi:hypothetical protein